MLSGMDENTLRQSLSETKERLALGERHIAKQRTIIRRLEAGGHDATSVRELLAVFEDTQRLHREHRDDLEKDLSVADRT